MGCYRYAWSVGCGSGTSDESFATEAEAEAAARECRDETWDEYGIELWWDVYYDPEGE